MNTNSKKALAGAAAAAITLGLAAPATAATTTVTPDALGDMAHGADIETVKVVNEKAVRIVIQHADLVPSYTSGAGITVYLDTDPKDEGPEFAFLGGLFDGTDYGLVRTEGWKVPKHPRVVNKFHIMKLDYENDVTRIRISRAALDRPGKVRVDVKTSGQQDDGDVVRDWLGSRREFIPWVARG